MLKRMTATLGLLFAVAGVTPTLVAGTPAYADVPNFRLGIQLIDGGGRKGQGAENLTQFLVFGGGATPFTGDSNNFDPDGARLDLNAPPGLIVGGVDFRFGAQALDDGAHQGPTLFTPWASAGGGSTGLVTDDNGFDPDQYRVILETRALPAGTQVSDARAGITAVDGGIPGVEQFTPWLRQGGGLSPYAFDSNFFDPDGFVIDLQVR